MRRPVCASRSLGGSSRPRAAAAGAIALINAIDNLGGYVGPFVVGWIKDTTNSFEMALYFLAASSLASGAIGREFAADHGATAIACNDKIDVSAIEKSGGVLHQGIVADGEKAFSRHRQHSLNKHQ